MYSLIMLCNIIQIYDIISTMLYKSYLYMKYTLKISSSFLINSKLTWIYSYLNIKVIDTKWNNRNGLK